jgi:hypothetical protein
VILALYDELSAKYASRAAEMKIGKWRDRFMFALTTSLQVLSPHRSTLAALVPVLIGDANEGAVCAGHSVLTTASAQGLPRCRGRRQTLSEVGTKGVLGLLLMLLFLSAFDVHRRDWRALLRRIKLLRLGLKR